jgi:hypothetical protein
MKEPVFPGVDKAGVPLFNSSHGVGLGPLQSHPWGHRYGTPAGIGASLSQIIAGSIMHRVGYNAGFLFLVSVAAVALAILHFFMPEKRDKQFLNPTQGAAAP